jgi:NADP-dependent 3-hydroxy acid dehydrogenase YdfG
MGTNYHGMVCFMEALLGSTLTRWSCHIVNAASVAPSFGVASSTLDFISKFMMLGFS